MALNPVSTVVIWSVSCNVPSVFRPVTAMENWVTGKVDRVQYKLCILMYTIHHRQSPVYLSEQANTVPAQTLRSGLRSASTTNYVIPQLLTKFGERAFSHAGPTAL